MNGPFDLLRLRDSLASCGRDTLYPQFADDSAEALPEDACAIAEPKYTSLFKTHTDRQVIDMLHFREDWGKQRRSREWKRILGH